MWKIYETRVKSCVHVKYANVL